MGWGPPTRILKIGNFGEGVEEVVEATFNLHRDLFIQSRNSRELGFHFPRTQSAKCRRVALIIRAYRQTQHHYGPTLLIRVAASSV
jgi:hypothetical protein